MKFYFANCIKKSSRYIMINAPGKSFMRKKSKIPENI
jgi:hypothetical protein